MLPSPLQTLMISLTRQFMEMSKEGHGKRPFDGEGTDRKRKHPVPLTSSDLYDIFVLKIGMGTNRE